MKDKRTIMPKADVISIIPARGGSQRVPGKNLISVNGRPLLAWSVEASLSAASVARTFVTTNDPEIADEARRCGAEIVIRPDSLSGHTASSESALLHALDHLRETEGLDPEVVVFLQATSPLRREGDIDGAVDLLLRENADSLLSVSPTPGFLWQVEDGCPTPLTFDPWNRPRSQELENRYVTENGSIYVFRTALLRETNCRLGGKIVPYFQPAICAVDIDHPQDVAIVDTLMRAGVLGS